MTWPINGFGRPGTITSHVCVERSCLPSGRLTVRGHTATCRFGTGMPCWINIDVAPVSAMPSVGLMSIGLGLLASSAVFVERWGTGRVPRAFDVFTVTSSLTASVIRWVGSKGTETKLLNLFAMFASAPPCHMLPRPPPEYCFCGNCVFMLALCARAVHGITGCILPSVVFLVVWFAPHQGTRRRRVAVLDIKTTGKTSIPVSESLNRRRCIA